MKAGHDGSASHLEPVVWESLEGSYMGLFRRRSREAGTKSAKGMEGGVSTRAAKVHGVVALRSEAARSD